MAGAKFGGFKLFHNGELAYLQAPLLVETGVVDQAFSTRTGGCSEEIYRSLNMAFHTGDRTEPVMENRRRFLGLWGFSPSDIVAGEQVHGTGIKIVTERERGRGSRPGNALPGCDALVTQERGLVLTAFAADCLLLFFLEPALPVIALAHAGWRGTAGNMAGLVTGFLQRYYGVQAENILVAISPGICSRCYTVGRDTAVFFAGSPFLYPDSGGTYRLDLPAMNVQQLLAAGIRPDHLSVAGWCTCCRPELFYSYRRERGMTGRMAGMIAIKPSEEVCSVEQPAPATGGK